MVFKQFRIQLYVWRAAFCISQMTVCYVEIDQCDNKSEGKCVAPLLTVHVVMNSIPHYKFHVALISRIGM
jgi:hypothetical protein